jgi:hypothetical protein
MSIFAIPWVVIAGQCSSPSEAQWRENDDAMRTVDLLKDLNSDPERAGVAAVASENTHYRKQTEWPLVKDS